MGEPNVRKLTAVDLVRGIDTLVTAFTADPVTRWLWPDPHQYLTSMAPFTRAFAGKAFVHDSAYGTSDFGGVSLWLPPGIHVDDQPVTEILERTVSQATRAAAFSVFGQMAGFHPREPHWYLPIIGADPAYQGRGYGSALLRYALERSDRDGVVAYLEATNARNVSLYKRHGFVEMGRIEAGGSPPLVPMVRQPR
jgi:ribosomal protein S18 acetylase RimI-like enzyme